jgi:hypothetical protein
MMTHDEMIAVIQAHKDGKKLEFRDQRFTEFKEWVQCLEPHWNFKDCDYRIKPEPMVIFAEVSYITGQVFRASIEPMFHHGNNTTIKKFIEAL